MVFISMCVRIGIQRDLLQPHIQLSQLTISGQDWKQMGVVEENGFASTALELAQLRSISRRVQSRAELCMD